MHVQCRCGFNPTLQCRTRAVYILQNVVWQEDGFFDVNMVNSELALKWNLAIIEGTDLAELVIVL